MTKTIRAALAAAVAAVCAVSASTSIVAQEVVRVGNLKLAHFAAVSYVKTIAADCGIAVDDKTFAKGVDIMQAMIAGELDVGATASEAAVSARGNGAPIYIVGGFARGGARLLSVPDTGIKAAADLKGKKVGVTRGSIQEILLAAVLGQASLTSSDQSGKDVYIVYLSYPDLNQALLQKQVDAIMQTEPQSSQAIARGFGYEMLKPYDTPLGSPIRTLVMSEKFYKEKKPLAAKFMNCFVKATKTFIERPDVAETFVSETLFKGQVTSEEFKAAIANSPYAIDMSAAHIQITTDTMVKYGIGKMATPPVATDWVKLDLLDAAKAAAGVK